MRYKESFVTTVNSLDDLSNQLKATNYEQIAKSLEKSSAGLNKAIESIVSKIDYDTIYKSITASSLAASEAIRSISENYSKILNTVPKIITDYSSSIETVYKSLNSFYNSKEFIALCETLINSNNYNYSEEDTKEVINSITYKDIENINKIEIKNDHSLPKQIILWLMITFILEPLIAIPQEQITNWYKEQILKIAEFINNKYKQLSEISIFSTEKISVSKLNRTSYISTENMLPNLSGITESASLPKVDKVTSFKKGDILLSNIRPYFKKMWYATFDGGCSNDVLVIRNEEGIDSKCLYYFLSQPTFFQYVTETSKGTKMPRGDKQAIMKYSIYVPSSIVQKKIVKILESIDKKIVLNKKINNNLHDLAEQQFNEIYLKGSPKKLGELLVNISTGSRPKGGAQDCGVPSIGAEKIEKFGVYNYSSEKYISEEYYERLKNGKLNSGDVLLYKDGAYTGKVSMCLNGFPHKKAAVNEHVFILNTKNNWAQNYLYFTLYNRDNKEMIHRLACSKAAQPGLNQIELKSVEVNICDEKEIINFENSVKPIMEKISSNTLENKKLVELRDTLLPKLMNGEIDLDNIEI